MKRVLSIQDLSCVGKCSLTVALPVLSAMGCQCSVLPTTLLSTHTGFPNPHRRSLTEDMSAIMAHWRAQNIGFDAVTVGYLADQQQADTVLQILEQLDSFVIVDPVMGDHGKLYRSLDESHITAMAQLCRAGHILLPNVTEAALLTGMPYREQADPGYYRELTAEMLGFGAETVIMTGVSPVKGRIGFAARGKDWEFSYDSDCIPKTLHGTGDLFCAALTGALMAGKSIQDAAVMAAKFIHQVVSVTETESPFGVRFEDQLHLLWEQL